MVTGWEWTYWETAGKPPSPVISLWAVGVEAENPDQICSRCQLKIWAHCLKFRQLFDSEVPVLGCRRRLSGCQRGPPSGRSGLSGSEAEIADERKGKRKQSIQKLRWTGRREAPTPKWPFWADGAGYQAVAEVTQVTVLGYRVAKQREHTEERESRAYSFCSIFFPWKNILKNNALRYWFGILCWSLNR